MEFTSFEIDNKTKATVIKNPEAVLDATDFKVFVKLTGVRIPGKARPGLDLVTVLDVSESMRTHDKIGKLRTAMQFLIKKLTMNDRLAVVLFTLKGDIKFELGPITESSRPVIETIINNLTADGKTDILAGLEAGLDVLKEVREKETPSGRTSAIILMTDGDKKKYEYKPRLSQMDVSVPVHTFGIGVGYNPEIIQAITKKSKGGTLSDVTNGDNLSTAFSVCLAGLLSVAVKDLTLTLTAVPTESEINKEKVFAGDYPKKELVPGSVTVEFGDLYDQETRTVTVDLHLPRVVPPPGDTVVGADVLFITYSLTAEGGKPFKSARRKVSIDRVGTGVGPNIPELMEEEDRHRIVCNIKEAIGLVEKGSLGDALDLLEVDQDYLKRGRGAPKGMFKALLSDVSQLIQLMKDEDNYGNQGRAYAFSLETSHDRQRFAARGNEVTTGGMYATPRMNTYIEQAKGFPDTPVPTADEDEKVEDEKKELEDPRGATARALSLHIQTSVEALQTIIESLKAIESIIY